MQGWWACVGQQCMVGALVSIFTFQLRLRGLCRVCRREGGKLMVKPVGS